MAVDAVENTMHSFAVYILRLEIFLIRSVHELYRTGIFEQPHLSSPDGYVRFF